MKSIGVNGKVLRQTLAILVAMINLSAAQFHAIRSVGNGDQVNLFSVLLEHSTVAGFAKAVGTHSTRATVAPLDLVAIRAEEVVVDLAKAVATLDAAATEAAM